MTNQTSYKPDYTCLPPLNRHFLTPLYDIVCSMAGLGKSFKEKVLQTIRLQDGWTVADVGCGTGTFLKIARERHPQVRFIGLEPDKRALVIARARLRRAGADVALREAFAESLPLPDCSVDACFSTLMLHHLPDRTKRRAIAEMHRILKPGGFTVIADFGESRSALLRKMLFFEKLEYLDGNLKDLIPQYLTEIGFRDITTVFRHFPGIHVLRAQKLFPV